jgi:zinc transporter 1
MAGRVNGSVPPPPPPGAQGYYASPAGAPPRQSQAPNYNNYNQQQNYGAQQQQQYYNPHQDPQLADEPCPPPSRHASRATGSPPGSPVLQFHNVSPPPPPSNQPPSNNLLQAIGAKHKQSPSLQLATHKRGYTQFEDPEAPEAGLGQVNVDINAGAPRYNPANRFGASPLAGNAGKQTSTQPPPQYPKTVDMPNSGVPRTAQALQTATPQNPPIYRRYELNYQDHPANAPAQGGWRDDPDARRIVMAACLTTTYFTIELAFGIKIRSVALVADSFHQLSDLIALMVALYSILESRKPPDHVATYGYARMEVVGGLINSVSLLSLSFTILIDSIQRFTLPPDEELINNALTLIIVACGGVAVNLAGLFIFGADHDDDDHGHGHGHGHGGGEKKKTVRQSYARASHARYSVAANRSIRSQSRARTLSRAPGRNAEQDQGAAERKRNVNIQGILIHVLGDMLGSLGVIGSGLFILLTNFDRRTLADPVSSIFITILIGATSINLMRLCIGVLLQRVPDEIDTRVIRAELMKTEGVLEVHEFHIWELLDDRNVCSLHVILLEEADFMRISDELKAKLHKYDIHNTTIQPEFIHPSHPFAAYLLSSRSLAHNNPFATPSGAYLMPDKLLDFCHEPLCSEDDCTDNIYVVRNEDASTALIAGPR